MWQIAKDRGPYRKATWNSHAQAFQSLASAECQLLNAVGAARTAARRIEDQSGLAALLDDILGLAGALEEAAGQVRKHKRAALAEWRAEVERAHERIPA